MGPAISNNVNKLPDKAANEAMLIFQKIDEDNNAQLCFSECVDYWQETFPMTNTKKMISEVDKDHDGLVSKEEWMSFWEYLYNNGYDEEMIISELHKITTNKVWVKLRQGNMK